MFRCIEDGFVVMVMLMSCSLLLWHKEEKGIRDDDKHVDGGWAVGCLHIGIGPHCVSMVRGVLHIHTESHQCTHSTALTGSETQRPRPGAGGRGRGPSGGRTGRAEAGAACHPCASCAGAAFASAAAAAAACAAACAACASCGAGASCGAVAWGRRARRGLLYVCVCVGI